MSEHQHSEFDAIVVGSGIAGGWAVKELCERGLKVLLLERGPNKVHREDYRYEHVPPWELPNRDRVPESEAEAEYPIQRQCYAFRESTKQYFVRDTEAPYETPADKPFTWIRGYHLGGRSLTWHRQSYRLSDIDFEANQRDGWGVDWPIRYRDIAPWYDHVETFAGISGSVEGIPQLPDGVFQKPMALNCVEQAVKQQIESQFPERRMIIGRTAHLTEPTEEQRSLGRSNCQFRHECQRGCSFGAYFSSLSATLPAANRTGNLTTVTNAVVASVDFDPDTGRAGAVRVIDANTGDRRAYRGKLVFLCASALGSTQIMLNSRSPRFPNGIGNDSGVLGHYLMDHIGGVNLGGTVPGYLDQYYAGRRPNGVYIPRYRNIDAREKDYLRGFGFQGDAGRQNWDRGGESAGIGIALKQRLRQPGPWYFYLGGFGEMLPYANNRVWLDPNKTDQYGIPLLHISCEYGDNEYAMLQAMERDGLEMLESAGVTETWSNSHPATPGVLIHEMGTARMGRDPASSVLNGFNQVHTVPNLFVTDGACMTSSACQNPSLTYMALTARAANFAVDQVAGGAL